MTEQNNADLEMSAFRLRGPALPHSAT